MRPALALQTTLEKFKIKLRAKGGGGGFVSLDLLALITETGIEGW